MGSKTPKRTEDAERITHCPECSSPMLRDVTPRTVTYENHSEIVEMPGRYCGCSEAIHSGADMTVWGQALRRLKALKG